MCSASVMVMWFFSICIDAADEQLQQSLRLDRFVTCLQSAVRRQLSNHKQRDLVASSLADTVSSAVALDEAEAAEEEKKKDMNSTESDVEVTADGIDEETAVVRIQKLVRQRAIRAMSLYRVLQMIRPSETRPVRIMFTWHQVGK